MSWLQRLDDLASPDCLPFEQGIWAGLRSYGARLILFTLSCVAALVAAAILAILLRLMFGGFR